MDPIIDVGIDIGGTFTDLIAVDQTEGLAYVWKTLTTPADPTRAVLDGLNALIDANDLKPDNIGKLVHATTLITNALIERKGARTALVTTEGFTDLIEIGREVRYDLYDIFLKMPEPLVPPDLRYEVSERMDADGTIVTELDLQGLEGIAKCLLESNVASVAVCFLHSYVNEEHEQSAAEQLTRLLPAISMSRSSEVAGEIREYERMSTTAANAFVQPLASRYLTSMEIQVDKMGIQAPLQVMMSNGGTTTVDEAARLPVRLVESGPAAGALIVAHYARILDDPHVLAFDMGGTTAKLCAIDHGQPAVGNELEVARVHRFKRGSGLPIRAPSVELIEIGAGGGSIARIDELGLLTVGPESAGAVPGPACYPDGGELPTVTDADLILGYLNPTYFLGGVMPLDVQSSIIALDEHLAAAMKMETIDAAAGVYDVVNEMMATAAGVYIAERGQDPRRYALIATGGAGPAHAVEVARKLGIERVIIPPSAGVASAGGLLVAPPRLDFARSMLVPVNEVDWNTVARLYEEMESTALSTLSNMGVDPNQITISRAVDARYVNQGHEITIPVHPSISDDESARQRIADSFDNRYRQVFGRIVDGVPAECVTWRTTIRGQDGNIPTISTRSAARSKVQEYRNVFYRTTGSSLKTPIYRRENIPAGQVIDGPLVIEEAQATTVVGPDDRFTVNEHGCIVIDVKIGPAE